MKDTSMVCQEERLWNSNYVKAWTGHFLIHFSFMLIVPLLPLYLNERFGASKDTIGLVLAGYSLMALIIRPFSGYMVDSFPRKAMLLICNFFFVACFLGYIAAGSLTLFAIFRTIHGLPFGATTVSISTVAVDVLPSSRRTEGIGYFGLSNNLATAIGPALAIFILKSSGGNFQLLFILSFLTALCNFILTTTIKLPPRDFVAQKRVMSLDRFLLLKGMRETVPVICLAVCHGIVMTYVAIYGKHELGITGGTGWFFTLFAVGLILSRLTGARALRENRITHNASMGAVVSVTGFLLFAALRSPLGYYLSAFVIGLGNGHMYPAFQNMFINLAENNQRGTANSSIQTSWDAGSGLGVLIGGLATENLGYAPAFWIAFVVDAIGISYYFLVVRKHFEANKLR